MNQFKILGSTLLLGLALAATAPQCHADYVNDEYGSMFVFGGIVSETFPDYSVSKISSASPNGTLGGIMSYTGKAHHGGSTNITPEKMEAMAKAEYYWVGDTPPAAFTLRWFPSYNGGTYNSGPGTYDVDAVITGSQIGLERRTPTADPSSPQDDWDLDPGGGINYHFQAQGAVNGGNDIWGSVEGDMRSYPSKPTQHFTLDTKYALTTGITATGTSNLMLNEIVDMSIVISLDEQY